MFRLRFAYVLSGIATGLMLLFGFISTIPDGKLHIVFCDVGQGDGAYIRFPDGRDMVVDGGPNDKIIACLGRHMAFWDRHINIVVMTHPQKDHMQGLVTVFNRYDVDYFVRPQVDNQTEGYALLQKIVKEKKIPIKYTSQGTRIDIRESAMSFIWPSGVQIAKGNNQNVLGASIGDLNDYSLVFWLRYGTFDVLFTGDADTRVENNYIGTMTPDDTVEVLKVPHHGSKTGMNEAFVAWVKPKFAVISLGKNSYGHPSQEAIHLLESVGSDIHRTDLEGDIEIVSDGKGWKLL